MNIDNGRKPNRQHWKNGYGFIQPVSLGLWDRIRVRVWVRGRIRDRVRTSGSVIFRPVCVTVRGLGLEGQG